MAYWSCDSLKVPGFVIRFFFVNGIFVYSVYGQTEFPFRKPFETEFTIFPNGKGNFLKQKIITPTSTVRSFFFFFLSFENLLTAIKNGAVAVFEQNIL